MGDFKKNITDLDEPAAYRDAADHVWSLAEKYKKLGFFELSMTLKDIATEIHDLARAKKAEESMKKNNQ